MVCGVFLFFVFFPEHLPVSNRKHFNDAFIRNHAVDFPECYESVTDFNGRHDICSVMQTVFFIVF